MTLRLSTLRHRPAGRRRVLLATLLAAGLLSCNRAPAPSPSTEHLSAAAEVDPVVAIETAPLRSGHLQQQVAAPGSVVARRESRLGAEVAGRIERVFVFEGDRVLVGDPLFEIDPTLYEVALRQAEAGHDLAEAECRQLDADLRRAQKLRSMNVLAEQEIERLTTTLAVSRARLRQAAEAVTMAQENLRRTRVVAPFSGSIAARLADEGTTALVQPQTIVVVLQETVELEARAAIPESQMELVRIGDPALVRIEGLAEPLQTEVWSVSDSIDPATRTYLVKMRVPNPDHAIKAGVFAHVDIRPRVAGEVLLAPRAALRVEDGRNRLLLVREGRAQAIPVEVGGSDEQNVEILAGAGDGELAIVGDAARTIAPGMRVRTEASAGGVS